MDSNIEILYNKVEIEIAKKSYLYFQKLEGGDLFDTDELYLLTLIKESLLDNNYQFFKKKEVYKNYITRLLQ